MSLKDYSLEQQLVEPFRAIQSFRITVTSSIVSTLFAVLSFYGWWHFRTEIPQFWTQISHYWVNQLQLPWKILDSYWPSSSFVIFTTPKIEASVLAPNKIQWWATTWFCILSWLGSGYFSSKWTPLRVSIRYLVVLLSVSLIWFALDPLHFRHSASEWSKIYFLVSYGFLPIYFSVWIFGVLLFPISAFVKIIMTFLWLAYILISIPLLALASTWIIDQCSLLTLPVLALGIIPLFQLGWFVAFYSVSLSYGVKE